ncbi:hypothetical protein SLE2022_328560 [Rubroshorea leprosula]
MEAFSKMLNKATATGALPFHPKCQRVGLTHLCFVDDLLIFTYESLKGMQTIDSILKQFYQVIDLKVNYQKFELFCFGVQNSMVKIITKTYGLKLWSLPVKYLGVPLITSRLSDATLKLLLMKIIGRITSWSAKPLSFVGRLQLISSVIQGITTFWSFIFILPKRTITEVEKLCSSFLWKGRASDARGAKVQWEKVCHLKPKGGLGLKFLYDWNRACVLRFIWMLFTKTSLIWVAWIKAYQLRGMSFWSLKVPNDASWSWRKILQLRSIVRPFIKHQVGNGEGLYLWFDDWHPHGPLLKTYGSDIVRTTTFPHQAKVSLVVHGNYWKWPLVRSPSLL